MLWVSRHVYSDEGQEKQLSDRMEYMALSELTAFVRESNGVWSLRMCVWSGWRKRKDEIGDNTGQRDIRVKDEEEGTHRQTKRETD